MSKVTIGQIAEALGNAKSSTEQLARRQGWEFEELTVRGGRQRLYAVPSLPSRIRDAVLRHTLKADSRTIPALTEPVALPAPVEAREADLKDWQREIMLARLALVQEVERLARAAGKMAAIKALVAAEAAGELAPAIARAAAKANARKGESRSLSASTLRRWLDAFEASGRRPIVLAPAPSAAEKPLPPQWLVDFFEYWAVPGKPSIPAVMRKIAAERPDIALPPERTIQQHIAKLPVVERMRGRLGPRALRQIKAFVRRDVSQLWPTAVYVTDGHTHHEFVVSPEDGRPFRPEITSSIDVVTRRITGWSIDLSENTWGTLAALRHSFITSGVPDIWYVDRGKGLNNDIIDDRLTGLLARFDVQKENSLPYRSQARGVIERFHQTWIEAARLLPTYAGVDLDPEFAKDRDKAFKKNMVAATGVYSVKEWPEFVAWVAEVVAAYNARPHSSLPRVRDPETGKTRHLSPDEVWNAWLDRGWQPDRINRAEAAVLFRPQVERTVNRCEIQLFTNRYFSHDLEEFHGLKVLVGYDFHDPEHVVVSTLDQQVICTAAWNGNSVSYLPVARVQQHHAKRVENQIARKQKFVEIAEARREAPLLDLHALAPVSEPRLLPAEPAPSSPDIIPFPATEPVLPLPAPPADANKRPNFADDVEMAVWLLARPHRITGHDARHLLDRLTASTFRLRLTVEDVDVSALASLLKPLALQERES